MNNEIGVRQSNQDEDSTSSASPLQSDNCAEAEWPLVLEDDDGIRPNGKSDECFYCKQKVGQPHERDCVCVRRKINVRYVFDIETDAPYFWSKDNIEFQMNDSSWCANNSIDILDKTSEQLGCLCQVFHGEFMSFGDPTPIRDRRQSQIEEARSADEVDALDVKGQPDTSAQAVRKATLGEAVEAVKASMPFLVECDGRGDGFKEGIEVAVKALQRLMEKTDLKDFVSGNCPNSKESKGFAQALPNNQSNNRKDAER